jgi:DNA-binding NarL/FixJ family response regulator
MKGCRRSAIEVLVAARDSWLRELICFSIARHDPLRVAAAVDRLSLVAELLRSRGATVTAVEAALISHPLPAGALDVFRNSPVVIFGLKPEAEGLHELLRTGARGFLTPCCTLADFRNALVTVSSGGLCLCPTLAQVLAKERMDDAIAQPVQQPLSHREEQVFKGVKEGLTSKEIASQMHISKRTVDAHRASIGRKSAQDLHRPYSA